MATIKQSPRQALAEVQLSVVLAVRYEGESVAQVSADLGIHPDTVTRWLLAYDAAQDARRKVQRRRAGNSRASIRELAQENRKLRDEVLALRQGMAAIAGICEGS